MLLVQTLACRRPIIRGRRPRLAETSGKGGAAPVANAVQFPWIKANSVPLWAAIYFWLHPGQL